MIHYNHNNSEHKNIQLRKPKRHALNHYRHTQRVNKAKEITGMILTIVATIALVFITMIITLN